MFLRGLAGLVYWNLVTGETAVVESVCVFCGSNPGRGDRYLGEAVRLGEMLAGEGVTVVYGGAGIGVMGELARAAMRVGGRVVGVIPGHLVEVERAPADLHELHECTPCTSARR